MAYKYPDLPKRSDPEYGKMYREKMKQLGKDNKTYYKEYSRKRVEENPNYWAEKYDKEKSKEYRENNKASLMEKQWKHRGIIDITYEIYNKTLEEQQNKCKICDREPTSTLHADHDHKTGKFRALLCTSCNNGLGIYEKNKEKYQQYLNNHDKLL